MFCAAGVQFLTRVVSSPASEDKSDYLSTGDSLPAFAFLTSDEERERKAEASSPGTYYVIVVPDSFSRLPEYTADAAETVKSDSWPNLDSVTDFDVVILETFEDITHRSASTGRTPRISPTSEISDPFCSLPLSPILATLPSPVQAEDDDMSFLNPHMEQPSHDTALFAHLHHVGWKQPFPHDRGQDDAHGLESCDMTLSVDFLEREASHFPPVWPISAHVLLYLLTFAALWHQRPLRFVERSRDRGVCARYYGPSNAHCV